MLSIAWRWNYRLIELNHRTAKQSIPVRRINGETAMVRWLGFIDADRAKRLAGARPVKLIAARVRHGADQSWVDVPAGSFVQGCLVEGGVYAVVERQIRLV